MYWLNIVVNSNEKMWKMSSKIHLKIIGICMISALLCSACQSLIPEAKGLKAAHWMVAEHYQRQDQIEVQWKDKSFSFLLYQQQQGNNLEMLALSLTGQPLFQLSFDGQKVVVDQRIDQMRLLPFDYIVRDLLYATYPNYQTDAKVESQDQTQMVSINNQVVLNITQHDNTVELRNIQVPYLMVISPMDDALEDDGASNVP